MTEYSKSENQRLRPLVLVVDAELLVAELSCEALIDVGIDALPFNSTHRAIDFLASGNDADIVVIDVAMHVGTLSGWNLVNRLSLTWPHIKQLIVTSSGIPSNQKQIESGFFLVKPYQLSELARMVKILLYSS